MLWFLYFSFFLPSFLSKWSSYNLQKQLYVYIFSCLRQTFCLSFFSVFLQFNDALMYTTPVQSAQYKLNSVLSLAGMKVRDTLQTQLLLFLIPSLSHLLVFLYTEILAIVNYWCNVCSNHLNITHTFLSVIYGFLLFFSRWVNRVRRPIRTSWTLKALNALSSCLPGQHLDLNTDSDIKYNIRSC